MRLPKKQRKDNGRQVEKKVRSLDVLAGYEAFASLILPQLQKDLAKGMTAEEITKKYAPYAAARQATLALTSDNESIASTNSKNMIEQEVGKPKEKKVIRHQFEDLADEELDALVKSKLKLAENE